MSDKAKLLICDDEKGVREALGFILGERYELAFVNDGPQALEHLQSHPTDLVLLDIKMPKMDGIKVLKEVKKSKPALKIMVITGYSSVATAHRAIKTGACDYITKPFDKDRILAAIETALKED